MTAPSSRNPAASRFVRGTVLSGGGMVVALAGGMISLKLVTNTPSLDTEAVGAFALVLILGEFLLNVCNLGMRSALPRLLAAQDDSGRQRLTRAALGFQLMLSVLSGVLVFVLWGVVRDPASISDNPAWIQVFPFLWVLPLLALASTIRETMLAILAGHHDYGRRVTGQMVYALAQVILVAAFVWLPRSGLTVLLCTAVGAHACAVGYLARVLRGGGRPTLDWPAYRGGIRFAWPLYINNLFNFVFQRVDTIFVGALLGPAAAGLFEMGAKRLPYYTASILNAALVPFLPSVSTCLAQDDESGARRVLQRAYASFAFLGYGAALALFFAREPLIRLLMSAEYVGGGAVLGWMMVASALALQAGLFGQMLIACGEPQRVTLVNVFSAGLSLALNVLLIPRYGMAGAGYAAAGAAALSLLLQAWRVRRIGLGIGFWPFLRPHVALLCCAWVLIGDWGYTLRACALLEFVLCSFLLGVVSQQDLRDSWRALRSVSGDRPC